MESAVAHGDETVKKVVNPAGSKWLRRWYKAKNAVKGTYEEALKWYLGYNPKKR